MGSVAEFTKWTSLLWQTDLPLVSDPIFSFGLRKYLYCNWHETWDASFLHKSLIACIKCKTFTLYSYLNSGSKNILNLTRT